MAFNPNALSDAEYLAAQQKYLAPDYDSVKEALAVAEARAAAEGMSSRSKPRRAARRQASVSPVADMALGEAVSNAMQKAAADNIKKRRINEDVPPPSMPLRKSHGQPPDDIKGFMQWINSSNNPYGDALHAVEEGIPTMLPGSLPIGNIGKNILDRISGVFGRFRKPNKPTQFNADEEFRKFIHNPDYLDSFI